MRTVLTHFHNEEYLLPWWLKHHVHLFDYGIMINHGSTDSSVDIIREIAPHWRIVNSRLTQFDAFLTDFEIMQYEQELPQSWKIALTITEFLMPAIDLTLIENAIIAKGLTGAGGLGYYCIDKFPDSMPTYEKPLFTQKHHGYKEVDKLDVLNLQVPVISRFYHNHTTGMYTPGRHRSYNPDHRAVANQLMIFKCSYMPWNKITKARKTQFTNKIPSHDLRFRFSNHHVRNLDELNADYNKLLPLADDLFLDPLCRQAIERADSLWL